MGTIHAFARECHHVSHQVTSNPNLDRFTFCQFPFILSTVVKKAIIQRDSEQQMISMARVRLYLSNLQLYSKFHGNILRLGKCVLSGSILITILEWVGQRQLAIYTAPSQTHVSRM